MSLVRMVNLLRTKLPVRKYLCSATRRHTHDLLYHRCDGSGVL